MREPFEEYAQRRLEKRKKGRIRGRVLSVAALFVIFATVYFLIMPAVTLEGETICGLKEHTHTEVCYRIRKGELLCTEAEDAQEAHVHDETCYIQEDGSDSEELVCGQEEVQEHVHTETCFAQEKELICELPEHTHTEACLPKKETEPETETELQEPSEKSTEEKQKIEKTVSVENVGRETGEADVLQLEDGKITSAKLYYQDKQNPDQWIEITSSTVDVPGDAQIRLDISYERVDTNILMEKGGRLCYRLPKILKNPSATGVISDANNKTIGTISLSSDNSVLITFTQEFLNEQKNKGQTITGNFSVGGMLDWEQADKNNKGQIIIGGYVIDINFESDLSAKHSSVELSKSVQGTVSEEADGDYLVYTLTATAGATGAVDVRVVDSIMANKNYVEEYVGVTKVPTAVSTETEVWPHEISVPAGKNPGEAYIGISDGNQTVPEPVEGESEVEKPGTMVWWIGDMEPNEVRILTYKVKLKENYTGSTTKGVISNSATAYSGEYPKRNATASFTPKAGVYLQKSQGVYHPDENGGGILTYTIWIQANTDNTYTVDNLRLDDSFRRSNTHGNTNADLMPYLTYDKASMKIFKGHKNGAELIKDEEIAIGDIPVEGDQTNPNFNDANKSFSFYVGNLAPGEGRIVTYDVKVEEGAFALGNSITVNNRAEIYADDSRQDSGSRFNGWDTKTTSRPKVWNRKLVSGETTTAQEITIPEGDPVYECIQGALQMGVSPGSFTVPAGSFPYTVIVNEAGDWKLSGTSFGDTLGQYLRFTGYMKVEAYATDGQADTGWTDNQALNAVRAGELVSTVWVKLDGEQSFNFTPSGLGIGDGAYAYALTYYAQPHNVDLASTSVNNDFVIRGDVTGPGGGEYFLNGIRVNVSVIVQDNSNFGAEKQGWYYEHNPEPNYPYGTLYWMIRLSGNRISNQIQLKDITTNNNHILLNDAVIGIYKGSFSEGKDSIRDYANLTEFLEEAGQNENLTTLGTEEYGWRKVSNNQLIVEFRNTINLDEGENVYVLIKTKMNIRAASVLEGYYTCTNKLQTSGDGGEHWTDAGQAELLATISGSVYKEGMGAWTTKDGFRKVWSLPIWVCMRWERNITLLMRQSCQR